MLKNTKIAIKLVISFFFIALLASSIIGYIAYDNARNSLEEESFNKLTAVREMKANQIEDYFEHTEEEIKLFSKDPSVVSAMKDFKKGFANILPELDYSTEQMEVANKRLIDYYNKEFIPRLNENVNESAKLSAELSGDQKVRVLQDMYIANNPNPIGAKHYLLKSYKNTSYDTFHAKYHQHLKNQLDAFGFYDIFLVDHETGHIIYSVYKEVDFATSLLTGPFSNTNIADAFRKVRNSVYVDDVVLIDYEPYHPSYNAHAAFIASPIFDGREKLGVLIFQIPIDRIDSIMTSKRQWAKVGLGESGETYIVGEDHTLRNQSRFLIEDSANYFRMIQEIGLPEPTIRKIRNFNSSVGLQTVKTKGTVAALNGETNTKIFDDYRGVSVLSSYKPLEINGVNWVIMSEIDTEEAFALVSRLRKDIFLVFTGLVIFILILSYVISRQITKPIKKLSKGALQLAKGNMDAEINIKRKDEIGVLAISFNKMRISIKNLIHELKEINAHLEEKVIERTKQIQEQKEIVEKKSQQIVDSINYAKRLQQAILPPMRTVKETLDESFILYQPKDIVSGDFYWMNATEDEILISAVDCTGHGVPGAMVSVVGSNGLNRCVREFGLTKPADIIEKLTDLVIETFQTSDREVRDGMDIALCNYNRKTRKLQFCGANNPLWILRKGAEEVEVIKGDKQPVGKFDFRKPFTNHEITLNEGDCIYIFTDGYADQFGGEQDKKFGYRRLKKKLMTVKEQNMISQHNVLHKTFQDWKSNTEQIDDVCVIGIRV